MAQNERPRIQKLPLAKRLRRVLNWSINVAELKRYIRNQKQHHRTISFQGEYRKFLKRYEIEFDERYVWD